MYQTAVSSATRLSRIAGPVCITRLAMRPAKSFWKNAQLWRTTCQWLCQRIRFDTLAAIAWLAMMFCAVSASGRRTSSTRPIPARIGQNVANRVFGPARRDQGDDAAHEDRDQRIEQREREAGREQPGEQAFGLARIVPIERDQPGRRLGMRGRGGRRQQPFEQGKHGRLAKTIVSRDGVRAPRDTICQGKRDARA